MRPAAALFFHTTLTISINPFRTSATNSEISTPSPTVLPISSPTAAITRSRSNFPTTTATRSARVAGTLQNRALPPPTPQKIPSRQLQLANLLRFRNRDDLAHVAQHAAPLLEPITT